MKTLKDLFLDEEGAANISLTILARSNCNAEGMSEQLWLSKRILGKSPQLNSVG